MRVPFWSYEDTVKWNLRAIPRRIFDGHYWYWWKRGFRNVFRYVKVVWYDEDFDWSGLAEIMAFKLEKMAEVHGHGHLLNHERHARELRIAAHCCRRMIEDEYFTRAGYDPKKWHPQAPLDAGLIARRAAWASRSDQRILGRLIARHFQYWWD